jgi:hypothetical protein
LEVGALLRTFGSLSRPFNNKGIRHGKAGKTPSLLGLRDVAIQNRSARRRSRRKYCSGGATRQSMRRLGF